MRQTYDAAIIGAGIIGAAIAFELGKRGLRTVNVDRQPAAGYGSTVNSCAIVRSHYSTREGVAMAYESAHVWRDWQRYLGVADEAGTARYVETGILILKSGGGHHDRFLPHFRALGVPYEELSAEQLARRFPYYDVGAHYPPKRPGDPAFHAPAERPLDGALFVPDAGFVVDPLLATHNLQRAAEAVGGAFRFRSEVVAIRREHGRVAGLTFADGGELDAPVVVNVAGPHSFLVNRMADVEGDMNVRTRALRHEVHHVPAPEGVDFGATGVTTSDGDLGIYFRPEGEDRIMVGSEDPPCDEREWVEDPDAFERGVTERQWEAQVFRLARRIPSLPIPHERKGVVDLYDVSDDWVPIYDRSSLPGFYMAVGTSGNQFKNAPVVGRLMAELIVRCEDGHAHDEEPVAIRGEHVDVELSAGFYSRRRAVLAGTSGSVLG